ncbi:MAG: FecR domain-containing protein [Planctomycetes bacterium]|nr:FecR domain-containing protein [Planctomycetota bacterium]
MDERTLERLNAYLDGELDARAAADAQCLLESDPAARDAFEALKSQRSALDRAFAPLVAAAEGRASTWAAPATDGSKHATPRVPWTLLVPIAAAALLGFVAGALWFREPSSQGSPFARVTIATAPLEVRARGATTFAPIASQAPIELGATLRTADGKVTVALADGSSLRLAPHTTLTIDDARTCSLDRGAVLSDVAPSDTIFVVRCDGLDVTALGTNFEVAHADGSVGDEAGKRVTHVRVLSGRVRVGNTEVGAGYGVRALDGLPGEPTQLHDLAILTNWVHELLVLEGDRSDELGTRVNEMLAMLGRTKMAHLYEYEMRSLGDHCVLPLTRFVQSPQSNDDAYRRREAARIASDLASPAYIPAMIELLDDADPDVRIAAARALERLTGSTRGFDGPYWRGDDLEAGRASWRAWSRAKD